MIKSRRFKRDKRCYPNTLVNLRASYHFKKPLREIRKLFKGEKFLDEAMWQLNMSSIGAPKLTEVKRSLSALMPGVSCMQCGYPFYIVVPDGNQYEDNELLLRTLVAKVYPLPLMPFMWSAAGPVVTFFTDSQEAAFALDRLNGQIEMPDGLKLMIWVCQSPVELVNLPGYLFRLSKVLKQLYCPFDNKLDLSSFHRNPALGNFYFPLSSAGCRQILANIVCDKYPDVQRINLAGNRLGSVCKLEEFTQRLPKLSALHLGHNELPNIEALDNLHLLPLVELCLDENLSRPYPNREAYHCTVRKKFPKLRILNGVQLPMNDRPKAEGGAVQQWNLVQQDCVYFIIVPWGGRYEKDSVLLRTLLYKNLPRALVPIQWTYHGNELSFYVYSADLSENIISSKVLAMPDTQKLYLRIEARTPREHLKPTEKEKLRVVLHKRYDVDSRTLDVTRVRYDPELLEVLFLVSNNALFSAVIEMVESDFPTVQELILDGNRITDVAFMSNIDAEVTNLGVVRLDDNKLEDVTLLAAMEHLDLGRLHLKDNPVISKSKSPRSFRKAVLKQLPRLGSVVFQETAKLPTEAPKVNKPVMLPTKASELPSEDDRRRMLMALSKESKMNVHWSARCLVQANWNVRGAMGLAVRMLLQGFLPCEAFEEDPTETRFLQSL